MAGLSCRSGSGPRATPAATEPPPWNAILDGSTDGAQTATPVDQSHAGWRTLIVAAACAGVLAWSGLSPAAQISSPTIYGTLDQVFAECAVFNGGTTPQAVTIKLVSEFGDAIGPQSCDGQPLGAGKFCSLRTPIDNSTAYACVVTAGSIANLSGGLVFDKQVVIDNILLFQPIRFAPLR